MKVAKLLLLLLLLFLLIALLHAGKTFALQGASVELGKRLFNDPKLGTAGKSCNTCHPDGKRISKAGASNELPVIVNACITENLKGKPLDINSVEMKSIILYIKSLDQKKPAATSKASVGC